jgi:hypothetical protein
MRIDAPGIDIVHDIQFDLDLAIGQPAIAWSRHADHIPTYMPGCRAKAPEAVNNFDAVLILEYVTRSVDPFVLVSTSLGEERIVPLVCLRASKSLTGSPDGYR